MATTTRKKPARTARAKIDPAEVFMTADELLRRQQEQQQLLQQQLYEQNLEVESEENFDDVMALNNVLASLGASDTPNKGFINVFKVKTETNAKGESFVGRFEINDYSNGNLLDHLKNTFGGGTYHITIYTPREGGSVVISLNKWIEVIGEAKMPIQQVATTSPLDLTPLIQTMQQGFAAMMGAMQANHQKPQTRVEMLEEMKTLRDIMAPAVSTVPAQNYDPVALMKLGMEMANNGGGDSNNAWVGKMIDHFAPFMMNEIKNQQTKPALPAPAPTPTKTPAPQQPVQEEPPVMMMMKGYLKMLAGAAAKNAPVEEYADSILDMIPDSELPQFEAMLRAPDWQAQLARHTDVVNAYPVWFTGLRETIIAYIDEDRAEVAALTVQSNGASVLGHENDNPGSAKANDNAGGNT